MRGSPVVDSLTEAIRPVGSRHLMNFSGKSQIMANGACPESRGAIVPAAAIKAIVPLSLVHLILWVTPERRVRE